MTIASEITNYANGLSDAYDAVNDMQGLIPTDKNMNNLDTAIRTIPQSTGPTYTAGTGIDITNDVISATNTGKAKVLTTDDYNYSPTGTLPYTHINLHWLEPGIYTTEPGVSIKIGTTTGSGYHPSIYVVTDAGYVGSFPNCNIVYKLSWQSGSDSHIQLAYGSKNSTVSQYYSTLGNIGSIDNSLTSTNTNKALSAKQGKVLKDLIDGLLISGAGAPTTSTAGTVGKLYEDTTNGKLYICTDATNPYVWEEVGGGATYTAGNGISIDANNEISIDDTVVAEVSDLPTDFTGATSSTAGANGLVPAPSAGDEGKALHGDGTWKDTTAKLVEMSYGEANSWAKFIAAYNAGSIVYCRASSNANPATGSQTRKAFMAYVNNATSPTSVEFQYVRSVSSKTSSQPVDQVFVYKLTNASGGTWSVEARDMAPKLAAGTNASVSYSSGTYTISATDTTYSDFTGATSSVAGANGLVPAPTTSDPDKYLKGDGTWSTPPDTTYVDFVGADGASAGTQGLVPAPAATDNTKFLKGDGTWDTVTFSLSPATTSTIGGVIVGNGISVANDGTISADTQAAVFTTNEWNAMWA